MPVIFILVLVYCHDDVADVPLINECLLRRVQVCQRIGRSQHRFDLIIGVISDKVRKYARRNNVGAGERQVAQKKGPKIKIDHRAGYRASKGIPSTTCNHIDEAWPVWTTDDIRNYSDGRLPDCVLQDAFEIVRQTWKDFRRPGLLDFVVLTFACHGDGSSSAPVHQPDKG